MRLSLSRIAVLAGRRPVRSPPPRNCGPAYAPVRCTALRIPIA